MSDELDRDLQNWFKRSVETLPEQPFALPVLERVWRRELRLRLQRSAAWGVGVLSFLLLLPELAALLSALSLRLTVTDAGGSRFVVLAALAALLTYSLALRNARR
jgi:hypothetical protein